MWIERTKVAVSYYKFGFIKAIYFYVEIDKLTVIVSKRERLEKILTEYCPPCMQCLEQDELSCNSRVDCLSWNTFVFRKIHLVRL